MSRTIAEKRHNDVKKALRKQKLAASLGRVWYDNLHQFSKNKIHCSCGMCIQKTNQKHRKGAVYERMKNWKPSDRRALEKASYVEASD